MNVTDFFPLVLMAATLLLLGEYEQIMTLHFRAFTSLNEDKIFIFSSIRLTSVLEQQYFSPMVPKSAITHASNTVVTATFFHKNVCKIHFETHYTHC